MNLRRGLLRLWLLFAICFAGFVFAISFPSLRKEFEAAAAARAATEYVLPVDCKDARGVVEADYLERPFRDDGPRTACWYADEKFRRLFPEYSAMSNEDIATYLYAKFGVRVSKPAPWTTLIRTVGIALGFPLAVFLIGIAFVWAFAGFAPADRAE
jgi:hypothetical protein